MILGEPPRSQYDLFFSILGTRVRVTPFFWVLTAFLGWGLVISIDQWSGADVNRGLLMLLWIFAVFVSILVHELGHVVAMRYFGIESHVVLYQFGGLAVPNDSGRSGGRYPESESVRRILISAAGPAAQLGLAIGVAMLVKLSGRAMFVELPDANLSLRIPLLQDLLQLGTGVPIKSISLYVFLYFLLLPSIFWALLNLIPVYPLDGGQIAREVLSLINAREGIKWSLMLSIASGGAVGLYGLMSDRIFMAIMFGLLAYSSYQTLNAYLDQRGRGGLW